jgi:hypothetical protein
MPSIFLKTFHNDFFHYIFLTCKLKYSKIYLKQFTFYTFGDNFNNEIRFNGHAKLYENIQHIHIEATKPIPRTSCLLLN